MNKVEINEIRRRIRPDKNAIGRICGCYVNSNREIISDLEEPLGSMPEADSEKYLNLLRKILSGGVGKNLIDITFSTQQVQDSDEHRLLMALRDSGLKDGELRNEFYRHVIEQLDFDDSNYLILMAHDTYDVPYRGSDASIQADASDNVFSYILCCVCPVRIGRSELSYSSEENEFHNFVSGPVVAAPELGFMFPAFDDRSANIYSALFYSKDEVGIHHEFIDAVFNTEPPMTAPEQKENFRCALCEALDDDCSFDVVQSVHEQLREKIEEYNDSKDPEPLEVTPREIGNILQSCGVKEERVEAFKKKCDELQKGAVLTPQNIIDSKKFEVNTGAVKISVDPEQSYLLEVRVIDGHRYILVPVDQGAEINGLNVKLKA